MSLEPLQQSQKKEQRDSQQVFCLMHTDSTKSARMYNAGTVAYCFACKKSWNPLELVKNSLQSE